MLVNNAGISVARRGDMLEATPESFDRLMSNQFARPVLPDAGGRAALAGQSRPASAQPSSTSPRRIPSIASIDRAEYCLSKAGVAMMTKLYALRLAEAGIGVFEIRPGVIRTDMTAVARRRYDSGSRAASRPVRRWGEPEDIGRAAVALTRATSISRPARW